MTNYQNIPQLMRECKQWMLAGPDKHPVAVNLGDLSTYRGSKNNPDQWLSFGDACYFADEFALEVAFVTLPTDPFTIIDLDHKDGKVYDADAMDLKTGLYQQACVETYTELSRSGKGVHIVVNGKLAHDFNAQSAGIECYGNKGFVIITGNQVSQTNTIAPKQEWLDYLVTRYPRAVDDAQFADASLNEQEVFSASVEELALDDKFSEWIDSWSNKARIEEWMTGLPGDDKSAVDMKVMQLFVKFTRDRKCPDESAVRMFLRSPRGQMARDRKQDLQQYIKRTLIGAKARVALDDKRAKDYDFSAGSHAMLEGYLAKLQAPAAEVSGAINMGAMGQAAPTPAFESESAFSGFSWLSKTDLENLPKMEWVVKGLFPAGACGAIYGEPGAGKSFVAIDMIASIAEGRKWFNLRTKKVPVSVFALEGEGGLKGRVRAWEQVNNRPYPESVFFWDTTKNGSFALRDADARSDHNKKRLVQLCADLIANGRRGGVVLIDTLNQASEGADENSSRDMGELLRAMKFIQRETGSLVLIVHHATKSKENQSMRGHSSLHGAMDGIMEVLRTVTNDEGEPIENRRGWRAVKVKDGRDGYEKLFDMKEVQVDMDEDGPVMSVAITPVQEFVVEESTGEVQHLNVGKIGAAPKSASGAGGAGRKQRQPAGDRQAPPVTRTGAQNAPTWNANERAAGGVDAPQVTRPGRPRWQSPQQQNILGTLKSLCAQSGDPTMSANGASRAVSYTKAVEAVENLLPRGAENKQRNNIKAAFDKMVAEGAFGKKTHGNDDWVWLNI